MSFIFLYVFYSKIYILHVTPSLVLTLLTPPQGVKANMKRLYQLVTEAQFSRCSRPVFYRKLLFSLCFFHSILLERKKFLQLGWNVVYGFNDSDFEVRASSHTEGNSDRYWKEQKKNRKTSLLFHLLKVLVMKTSEWCSEYDRDVVVIMVVVIEWNLCMADVLLLSNPL